MSIVEAEKTAVEFVPDATLHRGSEIRVYSHSTIFYWWPVWVAGYVMAAITYVEGSRAVIVPSGSVYDDARHALVLPPGTAQPRSGGAAIGERSAVSKNLGVVFTIILLSVVFITNTPMRGLWSAIAVLLIVVLTVTFAWIGAWADVLAAFGQISIHMNMGFYVFFSTLLFLLWTAVVFGFDRTRYWRFQPGQLTHEFVFGGGQESYDTSGMLLKNFATTPFAIGCWAWAPVTS
jgi:hypothetical protein